MKKRIVFPTLLFLCVLSFQSGLGQILLTEWNDYASNPIFDPVTQAAYYPTVLYDVNAFSSHGASYFYKMWYDSYLP